MTQIIHKAIVVNGTPLVGYNDQGIQIFTLELITTQQRKISQYIELDLQLVKGRLPDDCVWMRPSLLHRFPWQQLIASHESLWHVTLETSKESKPNVINCFDQIQRNWTKYQEIVPPKNITGFDVVLKNTFKLSDCKLYYPQINLHQQNILI